MATYELIPEHVSSPHSPSPEESLGHLLLLENANWFIKIRTLVICVFLVAGLSGNLFVSYFARLGIASNPIWPLIIAAILAAANIIFLRLASALKEQPSRRSVKVHIWLQIVFDLLAVTAMVHFVGSTDTFIPFAYLFHIVLACIFLSARGSFAVLLIASCMYITCVAAELANLIPVSSIFLKREYLTEPSAPMKILLAFSASFIWLITWYLVSTLARAIRQRDRQLNEMNIQLRQATDAKNQWMLRTAHDLKAPFSGIETNIAQLKLSHWSEIPEDVKEIITKIESRSRVLRERIGEILFLSGMRSSAVPEEEPQELDVLDLLQAALDDIAERAKERKLTLITNIPSILLKGRRLQLIALLSNILSNAVNYSPEGGSIEVTVRKSKGGVDIKITDHGIGIKEDELPRIFDEYYRGRAARSVKGDSTGLGLAIVKEIAVKNEAAIRVDSEDDQGTTFSILLPSCHSDID